MQLFFHLSFFVVAVLCIALRIDADFTLYPDVSSDLLEAAFNISSACLAAFNATINCDHDLFSMAGNADAFFWSDENATALCTSACQTSVSSWWSNCAKACANDQLNAYGRVSYATWPETPLGSSHKLTRLIALSRGDHTRALCGRYEYRLCHSKHEHNSGRRHQWHHLDVERRW